MEGKFSSKNNGFDTKNIQHLYVKQGDASKSFDKWLYT